MNTTSAGNLLRQLARAYGIQTAYYDVYKRRREASSEALLAVLKAFGAPVSTLGDLPRAWRERRLYMWQRLLEPVAVAWDGKPLSVELRLPAHKANARVAGNLTLESGQQHHCEWKVSELPITSQSEIEGESYIAKHLMLPWPLPCGYHRFTVEIAEQSAETLVITAPLKAFSPASGQSDRTWGGFLPLYAMRNRNGWQSGDLGDLEALMTWVSDEGGGVVGTLPLLATFSEHPSPYRPISRLVWNEFYLDVSRVLELEDCPPAQAMLASSPFQNEIKMLRELPLVDYEGQLFLKRRILEELCRCCAESPRRLDVSKEFVETHPLLDDYARFRATCDSQRTSWPSWPPRLRDGELETGDYDEETRLYHLYAQWLVHKQMQELSESASSKGIRLYLDLPLGVHPDGYDVWRYRNIFATEASGGAPPDAVFTKGQNWGFPPLHPERLRQEGYKYYIDCLRHHMRYAGILRVDHVMAFHRLFWIPKGFQSYEGVYVRYNPEEFYAIINLETHRHGCWVVGENLGTVPAYVNKALREHRIHQMYVVEYELATDPSKALHSPPDYCVASVDTHDMPTFAGFWQGLDIADRRKMGLLDQRSSKKALEERQELREALLDFLQNKGLISTRDADLREVLEATLAFLSASPAPVFLVNLEDLWLETQPQNVPGTGEEFHNWHHRARYALDEFRDLPQVIDLLKAVQRTGMK